MEIKNLIIQEDCPLSDALQVITQEASGVCFVVRGLKLVGVITDGDIRRMLGGKNDLAKSKASDIMGRSPKTIESNALAVEAFHLMEKFNITTLVVMQDSKYKGIIHLHDILKEGIF